MRKFYLTHPAREDIKQALRVSFQKHGGRAQKNYEELILVALEHLGAIQSPTDPLCSAEFKEDLCYRAYHLWHAKSEAARRGFKVKNPSHVLFHEVTEKEIIVHALIPEMRDFVRHLP